MRSPETVLERYCEAVANLDKAALIALYAADVRMFDMMAPFQFTSRDEFTSRVDVWFGSSVKEQQAMPISVQARTTAEMALMTMLIEYSDVDDQGERRRMTNRLSWVLIPERDDWKIIHEHTSVPLSEEDDMAPMFNP